MFVIKNGPLTKTWPNAAMYVHVAKKYQTWLISGLGQKHLIFFFFIEQANKYIYIN